MLLEVKNLHMSYFGGYVGINMANLSLDKGQVLPVYGKYLSGKTSLLRCIAGLEKYEGEILFNEDMNKNISFTFPIKSLKKNSTVYDVLSYSFILRNEENFDNIIQTYARRYKIENILQTKISKLTDDEKKVVALVRCVERNAKLYLIDNPLNEMPLELRKEIFKTLKEDLAGKTVIYSTNVFDEAKSFNSKILIMANKSTIQLDDLDMLLKKPKTRDVLLAMGIEEYKEGALIKHDDKYFINIENIEVETCDPISDIYVNQSVLIPVVDGIVKNNLYFDKDTDYIISKNNMI